VNCINEAAWLASAPSSTSKSLTTGLLEGYQVEQERGFQLDSYQIATSVCLKWNVLPAIIRQSLCLRTACFGDCAMQVERAAAAHFGIKAYGVHCNG